MPVQGVVERVERDVVAGWAFSTERPDHKIAVRVHVDGVFVADGTAKNFREDLKQAGVGDGFHAFEVKIPAAALKNRWPQQVYVYAGDDDDRVLLLDVSRREQSEEVVEGILEYVDDSSANGWAYLPADPDSKVRLQLIIGDRVLAAGVANLFRKDLATEGVGSGSHAFNIPLPRQVFTESQRAKMRVRVEGSGVVLPYMPDLLLENSRFKPDPQTPDPVSADAFAPAQATSKSASAIDSDKPNTSSSITDMHQANVRGDLNVKDNQVVINGWLAVKGDAAPRSALLRCGDVDVTAVASGFRSDLKKNGVNEGFHAFSVLVPSSLMDGKQRKITLIDAATGKEVTTKACRWDRPQRRYNNFQQFLQSSMTNPVVEAPFAEEDKRCFAMMETLANSLAAHSARHCDRELVTIIMPVYNREKLIGTAIESVLEQTHKNIELIVVDDGSSDATVSIIKRYNDTRIRLISLEKNCGHSAARNAGLAAATGELICYLDSDNRWDRRYVSSIVGAFATIDDVDALYTGQLLYRGSSKEPFAVRYGHLNLALLENRNYIDLNCFSHRRGMLRLIGGFDENLKRFVDYDLILRCVEAGRVVSVPVLLSHYYYDKADNAVTNDARHADDIKKVADKLVKRTEERLAKLDARRLSRRVTVAIPNWQSLEDIRDCLNALSSAGSSSDISVIVSDNASDPNVVSYLEAQAASGNITLILNDINFGFTYAVNQCIERASPDSDLLILNNDAIMAPGAIQELQRVCYAYADAGMAVPRQILPAGTKTLKTHVPFANEFADCDVNVSAHHANIESVPLFHDGRSLCLTYAPFFATYIRRDVIDAIGPLDAEFGRHYRSDRVYCDLMQSALRKKIYYVPSSHVVHKLQKATDALRTDSAKTSIFDLMFKRNQWEPELAASLGFAHAPWDTF